MANINLEQILQTRGLDPKEVAQQLFPSNKYPDLALRRAIKGGSFLDSQQISKLALMCGVSISDLFEGGAWKGSFNQGLHIFTNAEYKAELNTDTWVTKIFHNDSLFHESIIVSGSTPMSEYFTKLDNIINQSKSK